MRNPSKRQLVFLDIEASGLGADSFPIEVGWAWIDGTSGSALIRPADAWPATAWDELAEDLHGISWSELQTTGSSPWDIATELNRMFSGSDLLILSDAPDIDSFWLDRLFEQSPEERAFQLGDFANAFRQAFPAAKFEPDDTDGERAKPHRAALDALLLRDTWARGLAAHSTR